MVTETKKKNWFVKHWVISIFLGLIVIGFINGIIQGIVGDNNLNLEDQETDILEGNLQAEAQQTKEILSNSFSDYGEVYCDLDATTLQKQDLFDTKFKDKYVKWTGEVSSVSESWGSYNLHVKHCPDTFVSDILITMNENQKERLLELREGDRVTYTARLKRFGSVLGLSADNGEIVI